MINETYMEAMMTLASDYDQMSQELFRLAHKLEDTPGYNPKNEMYSLVRTAEQATVGLRGLAARTEWEKARELYETAGDAMGIRVSEDPNWIKITVPAILPKRNARDNTLYLTRPLRACLLKFQAADPIERFERCVICIVHQYDAALGTRRVRDYDNIETKRFLDVIESVFLTNDSGLLCDAYNSTELGGTDCTRISIMDSAQFSDWLEKREKARKKAERRAMMNKLKEDYRALRARKKAFCAEWIAAAKAEGKKKWLRVLASEAFADLLAQESLREAEKESGESAVKTG